MITFIQFLITGLRLGSVYALIALGYTMVYGIIKLINFAHGDFIMVGGYTLFFTIPIMMNLGVPGWLAVVPAVLICACVGMLVELLAYRPVRKTGNNLTCLITAIAMSLCKGRGRLNCLEQLVYTFHSLFCTDTSHIHYDY